MGSFDVSLGKSETQMIRSQVSYEVIYVLFGVSLHQNILLYKYVYVL